MSGYIYFICLDVEQYETNCNIKVGLSTKTHNGRLLHYGSKVLVLRQIRCNNYFSIETQLIEQFKNKFKLVKGNEFFNGDLRIMLQTFDEIIQANQLNTIQYSIDISIILDEVHLNLCLYEAHSMRPTKETVCMSIMHRLAYMIPDEVLATILKLMQYKKLDYSEFQINADELQNAKVIVSNRRDKVKNMIIRYDLIENKDYISTYAKRVTKYGKPKKLYMLTYSSFFRLLISSDSLAGRLYREYVVLDNMIADIYDQWCAQQLDN